MTTNQNFLDEFDKFLPEINKKETKPKLKSPSVSVTVTDDNFSFLDMFATPALTGTYSNAPAPEITMETIDEAFSLLNKPISLGVSSRGCMPRPSSEYIEDVQITIMTAKIVDDMNTQINDSFMNVPMNMPYGSFGHSHYNTAFGYSYDDLVSMRYSMDSQEDTVCKLKAEISELKARLSEYETEKTEEVCENQRAFDFETEQTQQKYGYCYPQGVPISTAQILRDSGWVTEDFISPIQSEGRGSHVETLQNGQDLGMLDDLEYFQQKVAKSMAISSDMMKAMQHLDFLKAQFSTTIPPLVVDKDSEIGKNFIQELRANKFDDAMELIE